VSSVWFETVPRQLLGLMSETFLSPQQRIWRILSHDFTKNAEEESDVSADILLVAASLPPASSWLSSNQTEITCTSAGILLEFFSLWFQQSPTEPHKKTLTEIWGCSVFSGTVWAPAVNELRVLQRVFSWLLLECQWFLPLARTPSCSQCRINSAPPAVRRAFLSTGEGWDFSSLKISK